MILRRFISHVTEQNWFAVGLDVIVVIVGIFLGIQVSDWQARENEKAKAQSYLDSLSLNLQQDISFHQARIESLDAILEEINQLSDDLNNERNKEISNISQLFLTTYRITLETATIEDLKSTGNLDLIENKNITEQLLQYYSLISRSEEAWYEAMGQYGRAEFGPYLMRRYSINYTLPFYTEKKDKSILTIKALSEDTYLLNAIKFRQEALRSLRELSLNTIERGTNILEIINNK